MRRTDKIDLENLPERFVGATYCPDECGSVSMLLKAELPRLAREVHLTDRQTESFLMVFRDGLTLREAEKQYHRRRHRVSYSTIRRDVETALELIRKAGDAGTFTVLMEQFDWDWELVIQAMEE